LDALISAIASLGLVVRADVEADQVGDVVVVLPDGQELDFQVKSAALITADSLPGQLRRWSEGPAIPVARVAVAGRITADARNDLTQAGWNWLDLRGHLKLTGPGVFIDSEVPSLGGPVAARQALSGRVGVELAALLLLDPARQLGVRAAATILSRAPSSVSEAFAGLRAEGLVHDDNRPIVPGLFWELAENWRPVSRDVANIPVPGGGRDNVALRLGLDDVESTVGWAMTDTLAAAVYGAPVSARASHPPDFYVPDLVTLRRAVRLLGEAATVTSRAGCVRIAPTPLVCTHRIDAGKWSNEVWPLADPLFVALDLAQDPGRGRDILDGWTPQRMGNRVW
jgi:hypothetical protein